MGAYPHVSVCVWVWGWTAFDSSVSISFFRLTGREPLQRAVRHPLFPGLPLSRSLPASYSLAVRELRLRHHALRCCREEQCGSEEGNLPKVRLWSWDWNTGYRLPFQSSSQCLQSLHSNPRTCPCWRHLSQSSLAALLGPDSASSKIRPLGRPSFPRAWDLGD